MIELHEIQTHNTTTTNEGRVSTLFQVNYTDTDSDEYPGFGYLVSRLGSGAHVKPLTFPASYEGLWQAVNAMREWQTGKVDE